MTLLIPALVGGGALLLAYVGRKKTQSLDNNVSTPSAPLPIPEVTSGGVADPKSPANRMSNTAAKVAATQSPVMRGAPPQAPTQVSQVPTAQAPKLGTANKVLGLRLGMR